MITIRIMVTAIIVILVIRNDANWRSNVKPPIKGDR